MKRHLEDSILLVVPLPLQLPLPLPLLLRLQRSVQPLKYLPNDHQQKLEPRSELTKVVLRRSIGNKKHSRTNNFKLILYIRSRVIVDYFTLRTKTNAYSLNGVQFKLMHSAIARTYLPI